MTWRSIAGIGCGVALLVIGYSTPVQALGGEQKITVYATVAPSCVIIVAADQPTIIQQVMSNTSDAVLPRVYVESTKGEELPLSEDLLKQYQALLASHPAFGIGVITPENNTRNAPKKALTQQEAPNILEHILSSSHDTIRGVSTVYNPGFREIQAWLK